MNPCDPTDLYSASFVWNYKSSTHYKILKLKNCLVSRLKLIHDLYVYNSKLLEIEEHELNIVDCIKIECLERIDVYNRKWIEVTENLIEVYREHRGVKHEINDENDLDSFIENGDDVYRNLNSKDKYVDEIERCALKFYYFLNLIIMPFNRFSDDNEELRSFRFKLNDYEIIKALSRPINHQEKMNNNNDRRISSGSSSRSTNRGGGGGVRESSSSSSLYLVDDFGNLKKKRSRVSPSYRSSSHGKRMKLWD